MVKRINWDKGAYCYEGISLTSPGYKPEPAAPVVHATIRLRGMGFAITLPASARSPELAIVDLSGREVFRAALNETAGKVNSDGRKNYNCTWYKAPVAGIYYAVVNESHRNNGVASECTKLVVVK